MHLKNKNTYKYFFKNSKPNGRIQEELSTTFALILKKWEFFSRGFKNMAYRKKWLPIE
jgi:hypothetical protein